MLDISNYIEINYESIFLNVDASLYPIIIAFRKDFGAGFAVIDTVGDNEQITQRVVIPFGKNCKRKTLADFTDKNGKLRMVVVEKDG